MSSFYSREVRRLYSSIHPDKELLERIKQAKLYIDRSYFEDVPLERICNVSCYSRFHFIRLFKKMYGCTPGQHLSDVRIEHAKAYLRSGAKVADACYNVGFISVSSFSILFKKMTGLSPAAYKKANFDK